MTTDFTFVARTWYRQLKDRDTKIVDYSEDCLGPEKDIALMAMAFVSGVTESARTNSPIKEPALKAKIGLAEKALLTLWSAWNETVCGRYTAAAEHWRNLEEAPYFLLGFSFRPDLAQRWLDGDADLRSAYDAIKSYVRDGGAYQAAKDWELRRKEIDKSVQDFSHISPRAAFSVLPILANEKGELSFQGRSAVDVRTTRQGVVRLAGYALELVRACKYAFEDSPAVLEKWAPIAEVLLDKDVKELRQVFDELEMGELSKDHVS